MCVPYWFFLLLAALLPASWPVRRRRHKRQLQRLGLCPECGYDLTGNVSGLCPECGSFAGTTAA